MDIKLIAMDLDGTALQSDRKSFSPRLTAALEKAYAKGVAIAPVTGRQYGLLPPPLKAHPVWEDLVVTCNGGQVRKLATGGMVHGLEVSSDVLAVLLDISERFDIPVEFSVDSTLYLTERSMQLQLPVENLQFHPDVILAQHGVIVDGLSAAMQNVEKVNYPYVPEHLRDAVMEKLGEISVSAVWASHSSIEITHPDATKGNGIRALCRILDIPMESVMALGDSGNDVTMLRQAGLGVAMGNAPDFVKAAADAVTQTYNHDGAAAAIEQFVLLENETY